MAAEMNGLTSRNTFIANGAVGANQLLGCIRSWGLLGSGALPYPQHQEAFCLKYIKKQLMKFAMFYKMLPPGPNFRYAHKFQYLTGSCYSYADHLLVDMISLSQPTTLARPPKDQPIRTGPGAALDRPKHQGLCKQKWQGSLSISWSTIMDQPISLPMMNQYIYIYI